MKIDPGHISKESISELKKIDSGKTSDEVNIWNDDGSVNEEILSREGFVNALSSDDKNAYTKNELGTIYDVLNEYDGSEEFTLEELDMLTFADHDGNRINTEDISRLMENLADSIAKSETGKKSKGGFKSDERIQTDKKGNKYVNVESWTGNEGSNDCLSKIISNSYDLKSAGIKMHSKEYNKLAEKVMNANPEIYGTKDGGWRQGIGGIGRENAMLFDGERLNLPDID